MLKEETTRIWALVALLYLPTLLLLLALNEWPLIAIFGLALLLTCAAFLITKKKKIFATVGIYTTGLGLAIYVYLITTHVVYIYNGLEERIDPLHGTLGLVPIEASEFEPDTHFGIKYRSYSYISDFFIFTGQVGEEELVFKVNPRKLEGISRYAIELKPNTIIERISNQSR